MPLANGTKLGPYEIVAPLGAGGMGEVYRARDSRLDRVVAIKVLPPHLADRPDLRERFEREARTIASLNHPHICTLHDIGREAGTDYLVMELVEGETLAQRLLKGPLPAEQVLQYAIEIADALDKAHRNGITHRDLKPGNIMLTKSGVKLLDFGLAKLTRETAVTSATLTTLPAVDRPITAEGTIVGTLQYMAPEQLESREADARTDIFSFGTVIYEMATGKKAFEGKSQASLIAKILEVDPPPISSLQPMTPPALDRVVKKCLAKDPDDRWQSAGDLRDELKWISEAGSQAGVAAPVVAHRRSRERIAWALAATACAALLVAAALVFVYLRPYLNQPKPSVTRFLFSLPSEDATWGAVSLSPDGRLLAFTALTKDGTRQLWLRALNNVAAQPLAGTDGARRPFWSPDSHYLGFFDGATLKKVAVSGGTPQTLCDAVGGFGASWNSDGVIVLSLGGPLVKVPDAGGEPVPFTTLDRSVREISQAYPWFLPDGRHFLYASIRSTALNEPWLCVGSLDSSETKCLLNADGGAEYAPPGDLLYTRGETLMAQPFDAQRLVTTGDAVPIAEGVNPYVQLGPDTAQSFSASQNGILTYIPAGATSQTELQWFDRSGKKLGTLGQPAAYCCPALSPDGDRLAVDIADPHLSTRDIWLFDLKRATASRFTFDPTDEISPLWSPGGSQILFSSTQTGNRDIYEKAANGIGDSQIVFASKDQQKSVNDWSSDGRYVVYDTTVLPANLWILPLFGDRKPIPFVQAAYNTREAFFSPNGRYIAYISDESGTYQIYVQTFPDRTGKWQVSAAGGQHPQWRRDGKELFFLSGDKMMAVDVTTDGPQFEAGTPKPLFEADFLSGAFQPTTYVVTPDGQRFLAVTPVAQQAISPIAVVTNWPSDLKP